MNLLMEKKTEAGYTPVADKKDGNNLVRLRQLVHTMKAMYMKLQPLLETMTNTVKTHLPFLKTTTLLKNFPVSMRGIAKTVAMNLAKKFIKVKPTSAFHPSKWAEGLLKFKDAITTEQGRSAALQQLIVLALENIQSIQTLRQIILAFIQNRVAPQYLPMTELKATLEEHNTNQGAINSVNEELEEIMELPLTHLIKFRTPKASVNDVQRDVYGVYTVIPQITHKNLYYTFEINALPFTHDNKNYRQYQPKHSRVMMRSSDAKLYIHDREDYLCVSYQNDFRCQLCSLKRNPRRIVDDCTKGIIEARSELIVTDCPYVTDPEVSDVTIRISDRKWAYTVQDDAKIEANCNNTTEITQLPTTGVIELPEESACNFKIINGPFTEFQPYFPNYNLTILQVKVRKPRYVSLMELIKEHMRMHAHYYFIGILLATAVMMIITCIIAYCLCTRQRRTKPQRQTNITRQRQFRRQKRQAEEEAEIIEIPSPIPSPVRVRPIPPIPMQLALPAPRPFWAVTNLP